MTSSQTLPNALMTITARPDQIFVRGQGSRLWDSDGKAYLDFVQGWAVNCLGHSPAILADALQEQARTLITPSPAYYNAPSLELARLLCRSSSFDEVFFTNSGSEANEGAIKLARKFGQLHRGGAHEIITFDGAFHGRTLATMSASGKKAFEPLFEPKVPGFKKAEFNDLASVEALIGDQTVAIMLEPVQGEAGVWPATTDFLQNLQALARAHGLLLIVDEIQTGFGRTGTLFCYEQAGLSPDIMTLGKGIGGGVPLGALLATKAASCFEHGDQGGTYNGNPLMCAAGLAIFKTISDPAFLAEVVSSGQVLRTALEGLSHKHGLGRVRGQGLLQALDLKRPVGGRLVELALENGLLVNSPRPDTLRFMPALNLETSEIGEMAGILDAILTEFES